jgi:hypothetical protein
VFISRFFYKRAEKIRMWDDAVRTVPFIFERPSRTVPFIFERPSRTVLNSKFYRTKYSEFIQGSLLWIKLHMLTFTWLDIYHWSAISNYHIVIQNGVTHLGYRKMWWDRSDWRGTWCPRGSESFQCTCRDFFINRVNLTAVTKRGRIWK